MKRIVGRSARRQGSIFAPEILEGRQLLSTARPTSAIMAEAVTSTVSEVTGNIVVRLAPDALLTPNPPGFVGYNGHGATRQVGPAILGMTHQATQSTAANTEILSHGSGVLTTARGPKIDFAYSGISVVRTGSTRALTLTGTVASGTGRFSNETGVFAATGVVPPSGKFTLSFTIILNTPA